MCDVRMLRAAKMDFDAAEALFKIPYNDEAFVNRCAYMLQQCVEKVLKGFLEFKGVTIPNTHKIEKLIDMSFHNGSNVAITEWIEEHAEMLSTWEAETRYNFDYTVQRKKIEKAFVEIEIFLRKNGVSYELLPEIDEEVIKDIKARIPKEEEPEPIELNCYYKALVCKRDL